MLLLRHRARRIMIVCPAGLTVKWHDEMAEKFGLEFTVVDSERCAQLRRDPGMAANPFAVFPLTIVSLPLAARPKAQRLLDEVLPPDAPATPRALRPADPRRGAPRRPRRAEAGRTPSTRSRPS